MLLAPVAEQLKHTHVILASQSARRRELISKFGIDVEMVVSGFEETLDKAAFVTGTDYARETAFHKAKAVFEQAERSRDTLVIGADTVVEAGDVLLEKPKDVEDAKRMLRFLSNRTHNVVTAVSLMYAKAGQDPQIYGFVEVTEVTFANLSDQVIDAYVATGECMDAAGAYAIQGGAMSLVSSINGDYFNVVGLPVHKLCASIVSIFQPGPEGPMNCNATYTLVLVRHGESAWNQSNRFTGWHDVPLTDLGKQESLQAGDLLRAEGFEFDMAYTSYLKRAIKTCWTVLEQLDQSWIPIINAWQLNERHYGALTGLNKQETADKHGKEQVLIWRRSYDIPPPALDESSEYFPGNDRRYQSMAPEQWPKTESLKVTLDRVLPYWETDLAPAIRSGKRLLVAAHGNSLRALVKYLDNIPDDEITGLNIPTGVPLVYHLDANLRPIPSAQAIAPLTGRYLGDAEEVAARIAGVKNQTK